MATGQCGHVCPYPSRIVTTFNQIRRRVGAAYGPRFAVWDIKNLQGGRPFQSGISFPDGGHHFW